MPPSSRLQADQFRTATAAVTSGEQQQGAIADIAQTVSAGGKHSLQWFAHDGRLRPRRNPSTRWALRASRNKVFTSTRGVPASDLVLHDQNCQPVADGAERQRSGLAFDVCRHQGAAHAQRQQVAPASFYVGTRESTMNCTATADGRARHRRAPDHIAVSARLTLTNRQGQSDNCGRYSQRHQRQWTPGRPSRCYTPAIRASGAYRAHFRFSVLFITFNVLLIAFFMN